MAEVQYRVILENHTDGKDEPVSLPGGSRQPAAPITPEEAQRKKDQGVNMAGLVAINQITPYITQAVNFGISQISMTHGSDELQRKVQVVSSITVGYNLTSIQIQSKIEDENIALKKSRAGLAVNRSRTGGTA